MIEGAKVLGEAAKKKGMTLLYHNHDFEFALIDGEYALDVLYREVPASLLETELDICWVNISGEDPAAYIRKYAGRAPVVHLKDFISRSRCISCLVRKKNRMQGMRAILNFVR